MALKKSKQLPSGVVGEYWKIIKADANQLELTLTVVIDLFLNEEHKNGVSLKQPKVRTFKCLKEQLVGNLFELGYQKIKAHANSDIRNIQGSGTHKGDPDLIGAIDV